jgi:hypothetical protein
MKTGQPKVRIRFSPNALINGLELVETAKYLLRF